MTTKIKPDQADEITRLRAENEALRVDADRWQWWSENTGAIRNASGVPVFNWPRPEPLGYLMKGCIAQHLNSAVDAARGYTHEQS